MKKTINIIMIALFVLSFVSLVSAQGTQGQFEIQPIDVYELEDIEPYTGMIPPDHFLYGVKIFVEDIDEILTFNRTRKMEKKLAHAQLRLSEAKYEMIKNRETTKVMERYHKKITDMEMIMENITADNDTTIKEQTGLQNAQLQIEKHKLVLEELLVENPDNQGLQTAIQNTIQLEKRFEQKLGTKIEGVLKKSSAKGNK